MEGAMGEFKEYDQYDATGLAELIRKKEINAEEVCQEAISRIERLNDKLNAVITKMTDMVESQLKERTSDQSFYGVPFLLKDAHHAYKGAAMSQGCTALKGLVSDYDAEIVTRYKKAGLIILGKTNIPEFKMGYVTEPKAFGPTRNPWNTEYSSGGSSGGSAAAVAARIVPMASGTDEGGSIRVPSSYCGLFGLKPSRGRNPVGPDFSGEWDGISTSHVLTRSVRDSAAILDITHGWEPGSPYSAIPQKRPFLEELNQSPQKYRIAYTLRNAYGLEIHPQCCQAVLEAISLLKDLGHQVDEVNPEFDEKEAVLNLVMVMAAHVAAKLEKIKQELKRPTNKDNIEEQNLAIGAIGRKLNVIDFIKAKHSWRKISYSLDNLFSSYDMFMTPTLGQPPVKVGATAPGPQDRIAMKIADSPVGSVLFSNRKVGQKIMSNLIDSVVGPQMPLTAIANITGLPAMSVPLYWNEQGLPIGVQFIGRFCDEASLFCLASQLEKSKPWFDKKPVVC
jgi:amidase